MPLENDRTMEEMRLYTAGISDFESIREDNRIYIDKTELMYRLTKESKFIFLSRPRRFGKTLLCSTLQYYFQGRKDLFEGLKIEQLEKNWKQYPVFRFDISACKYKRNTDEIVDELMYQVAKYERKYGAESDSKTPGTRLKSLIEKAHETIKALFTFKMNSAFTLNFINHIKYQTPTITNNKATTSKIFANFSIIISKYFRSNYTITSYT